MPNKIDQQKNEQIAQLRVEVDGEIRSADGEIRQLMDPAIYRALADIAALKNSRAGIADEKTIFAAIWNTIIPLPEGQRPPQSFQLHPNNIATNIRFFIEHKILHLLVALKKFHRVINTEAIITMLLAHQQLDYTQSGYGVVPAKELLNGAGPLQTQMLHRILADVVAAIKASNFVRAIELIDINPELILTAKLPGTPGQTLMFAAVDSLHRPLVQTLIRRYNCHPGKLDDNGKTPKQVCAARLQDSPEGLAQLVELFDARYVRLIIPQQYSQVDLNLTARDRLDIRNALANLQLPATARAPDVVVKLKEHLEHEFAELFYRRRHDYVAAAKINGVATWRGCTEDLSILAHLYNCCVEVHTQGKVVAFNGLDEKRKKLYIAQQGNCYYAFNPTTQAQIPNQDDNLNLFRAFSQANAMANGEQLVCNLIKLPDHELIELRQRAFDKLAKPAVILRRFVKDFKPFLHASNITQLRQELLEMPPLEMAVTQRLLAIKLQYDGVRIVEDLLQSPTADKGYSLANAKDIVHAVFTSVAQVNNCAQNTISLKPDGLSSIDLQALSFKQTLDLLGSYSKAQAEQYDTLLTQLDKAIVEANVKLEQLYADKQKVMTEVRAKAKEAIDDGIANICEQARLAHKARRKARIKQIIATVAAIAGAHFLGPILAGIIKAATGAVEMAAILANSIITTAINTAIVGRTGDLLRNLVTNVVSAGFAHGVGNTIFKTAANVEKATKGLEQHLRNAARDATIGTIESTLKAAARGDNILRNGINGAIASALTYKATPEGGVNAQLNMADAFIRALNQAGVARITFAIDHRTGESATQAMFNGALDGMVSGLTKITCQAVVPEQRVQGFAEKLLRESHAALEAKVVAPKVVAPQPQAAPQLIQAPTAPKAKPVEQKPKPQAKNGNNTANKKPGVPPRPQRNFVEVDGGAGEQQPLVLKDAPKYKPGRKKPVTHELPVVKQKPANESLGGKILDFFVSPASADELILRDMEIYQNDPNPLPQRDLEGDAKTKILVGMGRSFESLGQGIKQLSLGVGEQFGLVEQGSTAEYTNIINRDKELYDHTPVGQSALAKTSEIVTDIGTALALPGGAGVRGGKFILSSGVNGAFTFGLRPTIDGGLDGRLINAGIGFVAGAGGAIVVNRVVAGVRSFTPMYHSNSLVNSGGKANSAQGFRLNADLERRSFQTVFTRHGKLTQGAIESSKPIQMVNKYSKDSPVYKELSKKGDIQDWAKYTTQTFSTPHSTTSISVTNRNLTAEIHFYQNRVTGEVFYGLDYKIKLHQTGNPSFPVDEYLQFIPSNWRLKL